MSQSLAEEADKFHSENPHVYVRLCELCDGWIARGYRRLGIATLWEVLRWQGMMSRGERYMLPNNHRAYYARLWLRMHPAHPDFFKTKVLRSTVAHVKDRYGEVLDI